MKCSQDQSSDNFDKMLRSRNADGRIYLWDVKEYFGLHDDYKKAEIVRERLELIGKDN